jgi:hypothetical protein
MQKMDENKNNRDEYLKYYDKWSRTKSIELFQVQKKNNQIQRRSSVDTEKLMKLLKPKASDKIEEIDYT